MRPSEILDRQGDLLYRMDDTLFRIGLGMIVQGETWQRMPEQVRNTPKAREAQASVAEEHMGILRQHLRGAFCYRVTEDMCDLLDWAAAGLEADDTWDVTLPPTPHGFVRFEKPMPLGGVLTDEGLKPTLTARWMVWGPVPQYMSPDDRPRTLIWWFSDGGPSDGYLRSLGRMLASDGNTSRAEAMRRILGGWSLIAWDTLPHGVSMGDPVLPLGDHGLDMDDPTFEQQRKNIALAIANPAGHVGEQWQTNDARLVHALWLLLDQTITVLRDEPVDRASRRRAVKKGLPPRVTTITLRRAEHRPDDSAETHVEWQHRWIVRGHWRWQACGVGRQERRRIWIHPFIKGPEGMPLKQSEKLYDLRR